MTSKSPTIQYIHPSFSLQLSPSYSSDSSGFRTYHLHMRACCLINHAIHKSSTPTPHPLIPPSINVHQTCHMCSPATPKEPLASSATRLAPPTHTNCTFAYIEDAQHLARLPRLVADITDPLFTRGACFPSAWASNAKRPCLLQRRLPFQMPLVHILLSLPG